MSLNNDLVFLLDYFLEHVATNVQGQAWRDLIEENLQFFLLLTRQHNSFEELPDIFTEGVWHVDVVHRGVASVDHVLLCVSLLTRLTDQHCKLTENVGLENGTS